MADAKFERLMPTPLPNRFDGIVRPYSVFDVLHLRGSATIRNSLAERGANRLWTMLHTQPLVCGARVASADVAAQRVADGTDVVFVPCSAVAPDEASAVHAEASENIHAQLSDWGCRLHIMSPASKARRADLNKAYFDIVTEIINRYSAVLDAPSIAGDCPESIRFRNTANPNRKSASRRH